MKNRKLTTYNCEQETTLRRATKIAELAGFTLIEVVITSAILTFLMASVWSASSIRNNDFTVMINQEKLRLLITRAKSMTINSVDMAGDCGYGIRIERNQAFIFLNRGLCPGNTNQYDPNEEIPGSANIIRPREGVVFITPTGEPAEILFIPPHPLTIINRSGTERVSIRIVSPANIERSILINRQGLISIHN